jgi:antitoxin MazE
MTERPSRARELRAGRRCDYNVITMASAHTKIVRIGNSQGIRIPKPLLDEAALPDDVTLYAEPGRLIVTPARGTREGWADAARQMGDRGQDALLDPPVPTRFDEEEWTW